MFNATRGLTLPTAMVGGWTPGASPTRLPAGVGRVLTRGSDLVIQNHYHPTGRRVTDQSSLALYFSKHALSLDGAFWSRVSVLGMAPQDSV